MRIFVAGATGAVGTRLLPLLTSAGHSVVGMTRTPAKADWIRRTGAEPAIVDALDGRGICDAVIAARPEVIVHEMTSLSGGIDIRRFDRTFAVSNRLRTKGVDLLLEAANTARVRRMVVQSFCGWPYARTGSPIKTEEDPLDPQPPHQLRRTLDAIRYLEDVVPRTSGIEGTVLRYGSFYGPRTGLFDGHLIDQLRQGRMPLIGDGDGWWSFLHIDDAATATAAAVDRGARGIYNIVDDEPAPVREWLPALATMVGARSPRRIPKWLGRLLAGEHIVTMMTECRAGSNRKAKRELGWQPKHPSWRQGFAEVLALAA
jgi:nucleoside-diphosphate-sugar epimerase